jgi:hypothetical protein
MSGEKRTSSQSIQFTCFVMPTVEVGRELSLVNNKVKDLLMITVQFLIMCPSSRSGPNLPNGRDLLTEVAITKQSAVVVVYSAVEYSTVLFSTVQHWGCWTPTVPFTVRAVFCIIGRVINLPN